jgi:RHS repeat-associated protein
VVSLTQVLAADGGTDQTRYLFGLDLIYQDDGNETRYLLADGLGSVRTELVSDTVEAVTTYSPYGNLLAQTGASGTVYGFTGEQYDSATDLLYLRARYYNPYIYRFLTPDSIVPEFTGPQSLNPYAYVQNNPVNFVDPSGHCGADTTFRLETRGVYNNVYVVIEQDQKKYEDCVKIREQLLDQYWWTVEGQWYLADVQTVLDAAKDLEAWFRNGGSLNPPETIRAVFGGTKFRYAVKKPFSAFRWIHSHHVWGTTVVMLEHFSEDFVLHELGHVLDNVGSKMTNLGGSAVWPGGLSDMYAASIGWRGYKWFPFRFWCPPYEAGPSGEPWINPPDNSYHARSPSEDFAQAFKESVLNHLALKQNSPRRANFMSLIRAGLVDFDD